MQACQGTTSPVPMKLIEFLERFPLISFEDLSSHWALSLTDFVSFGEHMEDKFHELFQEQKESTGCSASPLLSVWSLVDKQHVRVLWDIENIGVPRKKGGAIDTITRLQKFVLLSSRLLLIAVASCNPNHFSVKELIVDSLLSLLRTILPSLQKWLKSWTKLPLN